MDWMMQKVVGSGWIKVKVKVGRSGQVRPEYKDDSFSGSLSEVVGSAIGGVGSAGLPNLDCT